MATEMRLSLTKKENSLLFLSLLLGPCFFMMFRGAFQIRQTNPAFVHQLPNMPCPMDFWRGVIWALVIVALRFSMTKCVQPYGKYFLSPAKRNNVDRLERFAAVAFKLTFYVTITTVGFLVIRHEVWFPPALGGHGNSLAVYEVLDRAPSWALKQYYMLQLGYHLHSLIYMLVLSPIRNDFVEMFVHHVATILLIIGSYLSNYLPLGALVVFTHDIGDITGYLIKAVVDTGRTRLIVSFYALLLASWAYTRLFVYPIHLLQPPFHLINKIDRNIVSDAFFYSMMGMMCMLQLLHVYWYALFLMMGYTMLAKGKAEDIQQQCKESDDLGVHPLPPNVATGKHKRA